MDRQAESWLPSVWSRYLDQRQRGVASNAQARVARKRRLRTREEHASGLIGWGSRTEEHERTVGKKPGRARAKGTAARDNITTTGLQRGAHSRLSAQNTNAAPAYAAPRQHRAPRVMRLRISIAHQRSDTYAAMNVALIELACIDASAAPIHAAPIHVGKRGRAALRARGACFISTVLHCA